MKNNRYKYLWNFMVVDAFLYGIISPYIGDVSDIWAVLRYIILFVTAMGIEKECGKIKLITKSKLMISIAYISLLVEFVLGYYLSTVQSMSAVFVGTIILMGLIAALGLYFLIVVFQNKENISEEIKTVRQIYEKLWDSKNINEANMVSCLACLGFSMIILCIMDFIIPVFIRNTEIELYSLYKLGAVCFVTFCILNYKKHIFYNKAKVRWYYYIEVGGIFICTVLMYYVDGFLYKGMSTTNIFINFIYFLCIFPFLISTKKISTYFFRMINEKKD